jgi:hypothetical protein
MTGKRAFAVRIVEYLAVLVNVVPTNCHRMPLRMNHNITGALLIFASDWPPRRFQIAIPSKAIIVHFATWTFLISWRFFAIVNLTTKIRHSGLVY